MNAPSQIREHMEVKSSEGEHIGTVDRVEGTEKIKLAKSDPASHDGHHHFIPLDWVDHVDNHVHLKKSSSEIQNHWRHAAS